MISTPATWHGTKPEYEALNGAVTREFACDCVINEYGEAVNACAGHRWLATDQRAIDGLVFAARIRHRLTAEEFRAEGRREEP